MKKIVVIGGGPGGYVAALKAAILGAEVTLIEKDKVGGTCLNKGCIPTKALLSSVEQFDKDYPQINLRKDALVNQLVGGIGSLLQKRGVHLINGFGRIRSQREVEVILCDGSKQNIDADSIVLATGSTPVVPQIFHYDGIKVITSDEALKLEKIPDSMVIIGGGVIGCEFGQFFAKMGCRVTIIEMADQILPLEDQDVAKILFQSLKKNGIEIHTGAIVEAVDASGDDIVVKLSTGRTLTAEKVLVSIGRKAFLEGIGIGKIGIKTEKGKVIVNERMQTNVESVYAIGDIVDTPFLAHVAYMEALIAVENILGRDKLATYHAIPRCVYTEPEIACVGLSEREAKDANIAYKVGKFGFAGLGKAMVINKTTGFVKVITDDEEVMIGASIVGAHATDMIAELTVAIQLGLTVSQMEGVVHAHPTLSEAVMEAIHDTHKEAIHSY